MNIASPKNSSKVVSLKELIPQQETLKLLVLHTPFSLEISTLPQCLSLVKLDLSKNNIKAFPYLGHLKFLRIAFIHQNLLGINQFTKIFELNGERSILSENIVWITYWGNKNVFLARHYAINKTKAIAFDKNIIVQEERIPSLILNRPSFCKESDVSQLFAKRSYLNGYSTEEEYMQDFWISLRLLRQKYEQMNPIIKVQKVFRGWIFRLKLKRQFQKQKANYLIIYKCFRQWKNGRKKEGKLFRILQQSKKTYLLYKNSKINQEYIFNRMKELAQSARVAVIKRRIELQNQIKFYSILRGNLKMLQDLYRWLQLRQSQALYIYKADINDFEEYVAPFVNTFCKQTFEYSINQNYHLHHLHDPTTKYHQLEFLKIIKINRFSVVSYEKPLQKMLQLIKFRKPTSIQSKMKSIFGKYHMSNEKKERLHEHEKKLEETKKMERDQLLRIQGSYQLLRTIVRGIFFFNSKRFDLPQTAKYKRINFLSQKSLKRISSAVAIQRAWRGFIFRKKHRDQLKIVLKYQKAATIIQRWFRRLPSARKRYFTFDVEDKLNECTQTSFYIDFEEYLHQIRCQKVRNNYYIFLQQHAQVYKHKETGDLVITWDDESKRHEIDTMISIKKSLFNRHFLEKKIPLTQQQLSIKTYYVPNKLQRCDFAHLFHYQTENSIINRANRKFIQIQCKSKSEAKFRMLGISLFSFDFIHKKSINFYNKSFFMPSELKNKLDISKQQLSIVCNENENFVKTIESNCQDNQNISIYMINNKIFLQFDINKQPFKVEERFFIYLINYENDRIINETNMTPIKSKISNESNRYGSSEQQVNHTFLENLSAKEKEYLTYSINAEQLKFQCDRRLMVKKRSIKKFNAKVKRKRENHPSFIIDNKSTDRLTQNQSNLIQVSDREPKFKKSSPQISKIQNGQIKALLMHDRSIKNSQKKKQQQSFMKKFVNVSNFMQSQFINDHRRRIKTQIQQAVHLSAEEVRLSALRSSTHKDQHFNRKYSKARELQHIHRSLLHQSEALGEEHSQKLRNNVLSHLKKKQQERKAQRKPRVSFAQQNFPLVHNKLRNFSLN